MTDLTALLLTFSLCASDGASVADAPPETNAWTILFYGGSDNSSEESFGPDMADLCRGLKDTPGLEVFCLVDRSPRFSNSRDGFGEDFSDTRLYQLTHAGAVRQDGRPELPEITLDSEHEANSGDPALVRDYLRWARAHHPAEHTALIFYTHGNGWIWCPDESNGGDELFPAELTETLKAEDSVDLIIFDVCEMASLEDAWQWRPGTGRFSTDYMVATPMAGFPFPWNEIFRRIHKETEGEAARLTPEGFGGFVVEETRQMRLRQLKRSNLPERMRKLVSREAMSCLDLSQVEAVKRALDELVEALADDEGSRELLLRLRGNGRDPTLLTYLPTDMYIDVFALAEALRDDSEATESERSSAARLAETADAMVVSSYGLEAYDAFGGFQSGRHGMHLIFPPFGGQPRELWKQLEFLSPVRCPEGRRGFGLYEFCRDGATPEDGYPTNWFELLDLYFDPDDEDGGLNGYAR